MRSPLYTNGAGRSVKVVFRRSRSSQSIERKRHAKTLDKHSFYFTYTPD